MNKKPKIFMTGVGGQGSLTATTLLAKIALAQGVEVVAGEIHGMAQRGGVVESTVLLGGWKSPKLAYGEADILLGFEPLETLRALAYLAPDGTIFSSTDSISPPSVARGLETYPSLDEIKAEVQKVCSKVYYLPCRQLGLEAGSVQCGNTILLAALCATDLLPFGLEALEDGIKKFMSPKLVETNLKALEIAKNYIQK